MNYDVFISSKKEDYSYAEVIFKYLCDNGLSVFIASESLKGLGNTAYLDEIDKALESCTHMIVFTTKREYAESTFVKEEWQTFRNEKLSGRKTGNLLTIIGEGLKITELPLGLRRYEVIPFESFKETILNYVKRSTNFSTPLQEPSNSLVDDRPDEIKELLAASKSNEAWAQTNLGFHYYQGIGVQQNYEEAAKWFRKAAEQGEVVAQSNLGIMYAHGQGVCQSHEDAVKWYRKAAEQGDAVSQFNLGGCYKNGWGVSQSKEEAAKWFHKAAEQGNTDAQTNLGLFYLLGEGVPKSPKEAFNWYSKAANQGDVNAQTALGLCYENGWGCDISRKDAEIWYRKAAEQGFKTAEEQLKKLCSKNDTE